MVQLPLRALVNKDYIITTVTHLRIILGLILAGKIKNCSRIFQVHLSKSKLKITLC